MNVLGMITVRDFFRATPRDQTWTGAFPSIWFQMGVNVSLIAASIPYMKRFLDGMGSGASGAAISTTWGRDFERGGKSASSTQRLVRDDCASVAGLCSSSGT